MKGTYTAQVILEKLLENKTISLEDIVPLAPKTQVAREFLYSLGAFGELIPFSWSRLLGLTRCRRLQQSGMNLKEGGSYDKELRLKAYKLLWPRATTFLLELDSEPVHKRLKPKALDDLEMTLSYTAPEKILFRTKTAAYSKDFS